MIDTKELRQLTQAASPGPWWVNQDGLNHGFERGVAEINSKEWHALAGAWTINGAKHSEEGAANAEFIAAANPATVIELLDRLEAAEKAVTEAYQRGYKTGQEEIGKERDALRVEVERLTECLHRANAQAEHFEREWYLRGEEVDDLRAELEALKNQEPVAWMNSRNGFICKENKNPDYNLPLYARPIPAQSVPEGYHRCAQFKKENDELRAKIEALRAEVERLHAEVAAFAPILKAAHNVMEWIEWRHRPPVRDQLEAGRMVSVRLHALADLHTALQERAVDEHETAIDTALLRQCLEALEGAEEYDALLDDFTMAAVKAAAVALRERLGEKE